MPGLWNSLCRRWPQRRHYRTLGGWLLHGYDRLLARLPNAPLPARGRVAAVRLAGVADPVYVRLGSTDWSVLDEIFVEGEYAPLVARLRSPLRCVVDLGANIGLSIRLWQSHYPLARIIAVEPDSENLGMCRRNVGNGDSVRLVRACAAGRSRSVALDRSAGAWGYRMAESEGGGSGQDIPALTVPQILESETPGGEIDLLKCDIEGAEAEVFGACSEWIGRVRHLVVELHRPYDGARFEQDLARAGVHFEAYHKVVEPGVEVWFLERIS